MWTKEEFLKVLSNLSRPKFQKNVFREPVFRDPCVRQLVEAYRAGEVTDAGVFARLGETPGLYMIALAEGYGVRDISKAAQVSSRKVRRAVLEACWRAKILRLI